MTDAIAGFRRAPGSAEHSTVEGYLHELGVYGSDQEFRDLILPFVLGGLDAGEPVVLAYDLHKTELLRDTLPDPADISYVTGTSLYAAPARALVAWRRIAVERLAAGAPRVRIAGNVPHSGYGLSYAGWDRYEAALDRALGDLPVWLPCLYDARLVPTEVLERARRLHRHFLDRDGAHRANGSFEPSIRLSDFLTPPLDPLESTMPAIELTDPTPLRARVAVSQAIDGLSIQQADDLVLATSEAVTNALRHGVPPVAVRIWRGDGRVVINVHDAGNGPIDAFAGLFAGEDDAEPGRGLWLAHQLDIDVALVSTGEGFAVRLRAGGATPA